MRSYENDIIKSCAVSGKVAKMKLRSTQHTVPYLARRVVRKRMEVFPPAGSSSLLVLANSIEYKHSETIMEKICSSPMRGIRLILTSLKIFQIVLMNMVFG